MKRKRMKRMRVSVGISALNEENNIKFVINDVLSQEKTNWSLSEILVYCDGCSDRTAEKVEEIGNKKIVLKKFGARRGKSARVNQMMKSFKGNVLLILDGDIKLKDEKVISNIVKEFAKDEDVMLVGGNSRVFEPKSFFQKAIYSSYYVYFKSREKLKGGHNVFGCTGACLAVKKKLARKIHIPSKVISEDTYIYFSCKSHGYKFRCAKSAIVYYKLAQTQSDFLRQMFRTHPEAVFIGYTSYFGDLIGKEYERPLGFYIRAVIESFLLNPLGTIYMILLKVLAKPFYPIVSKKYKLDWFTAATTK